MILQPYTEHAPDSRQIQECAAQLAAGGRTNYGESVQKYAKLRTADFSTSLADWENEAYAAAIGQKPLQNVANALKMKVMSTDLSEKMLAFLQNAAKQGDTTAMLYLAYLHSIGRFAKPSLHTAAKLLRTASEQGDWRASQFWGELLAASPAAARELLNDEFQAAAETWLAQHPETAPARAEQAYRRFYEASAAIKWAAKSKFTRAQEQGSPTAEPRIKGLTLLGSLPAAQPAPLDNSRLGLPATNALTLTSTAEAAATPYPQHNLPPAANPAYPSTPPTPAPLPANDDNSEPMPILRGALPVPAQPLDLSSYGTPSAPVN